MFYHMISQLVGVGVFVGMLVCFFVGRGIGRMRGGAMDEGTRAGFGVIDGAIFALVGLMIAFTFSGAAGRFDQRRQLVIDEANCVGTAWLRIDLLPAAAQPELRAEFRKYLDLRLDVYRKIPDMDAVYAALTRSAELQGQIWKHAITACSESGSTPATMLLLPALNQMFDIASTRTAVSHLHAPMIIFGTLVLVAFGAALLAGHGLAGAKRLSWPHLLGFAASIAITIGVIIDLEYPRLGLIKESGVDQLLMDVRASMGP